METSITGICYNAKGGAVLVSEEKVVYVWGLQAWEEQWLGRSRTLRGVLEEQSIFPDPVNENGEYQQGATGKQWVLRMNEY
ncbi:MAG: hypothetical protein MUF42_02260 [Cytophagaceae bacterium]|nr:hypothetical protein [Cytophagaceae bacterium]